MSRGRIIIVGSGAAGLTCALNCADNFDVFVISRGNNLDGATSYAQGGVSVPLSADDSLDLHVNDTIVASDFLACPEVSKKILGQALNAFNWLKDQGVNFSHDSDGRIILSQEGGHSRRRIVSIKDRSGYYLGKALLHRALLHPNITFMENHSAYKLIVNDKRAHGVNVFDKSGQVTQLYASAVVLATGGASGLYLHTTSSYDAKGSGMAMAYAAGCRLSGLEFTQFHPTCFYNPKGASFLLTEVLRGDGAKLLLPSGESFMHEYHKDAELAPRSVVSTAIVTEMQKNNVSHVLLDATGIDKKILVDKFPFLYQQLLDLNIHLDKNRVPVIPAAHYSCGGVMANENGETDLENLFAIGEVACTNLHGANRLASNSLLECCVMGLNAASYINKKSWQRKVLREDKQKGRISDYVDYKVIDNLRAKMTEYVGVLREKQGMENLLKEIYKEEAKAESITQRNFLLLARLTVLSALDRKASRGCHQLQGSELWSK